MLTDVKTTTSVTSLFKHLKHGVENSLFTSKKNKTKDQTPRFSVDVQEEIDNLYEFVPQVEKLFRIVGKAGEGTFSSVFLAKLRDYPGVCEMFALKHIIPTSHPDRIEQELRCLLEIGGQSNVMGVKLCLRNKDHVVVVMPYIEHDKFQDYVQVLSICEVRSYIKNLLQSLERVHQFDIIHRDIKPSNFLYNRSSKIFALVDFGLAQKVPTKNAKTLPERTLTAAGVTRVRAPLKSMSADNAIKPSSTISTPNGSTKSTPLRSTHSTERPPLSSAKQIKSPRRFIMAKRMNSLRDRGLNKSAARSFSRSENNASHKCKCFGQPIVCKICKARVNQYAPRAGTPGFRSPEVLLKYPAQTTAVDIWSAGVIFLSLLSGRYPFFRANDDMTALAQIISLKGSEEVKAAAKHFGKTVTLNQTSPALNLKSTCCKLRRGSPPTDKLKLCKENWQCAPDSAFDLLAQLTDLNPKTRITAKDALNHPFFDVPSSCDS